MGLRNSALGVFLLFFTASIHAEVKDSSTDGFTIEQTHQIRASAAEVWSYLTNDIGDWWLSSHTWFGDSSNLSMDVKAGGCLCELTDDPKKSAEHMRVVFVDSPKLIRLVGGLGPLQGLGLDGALEWRLKAEGEVTQLTLFYRVGGYGPDDLNQLAPVVDNVLQQQMLSLKAYAE